MNISDRIDAFRPAEGPPPESLGAFMRWCLSGAWPALWLAAFFSAAAGAMEAGTALILGMVIDATAANGPEAFFSGPNLAVLAGAVAFFLIARPLLFGLSASANAIVVQPNVNPLVLSRLHRWTLGQTVGFFDDDFAGRIAQKQMQTARDATEEEMIAAARQAQAQDFILDLQDPEGRKGYDAQVGERGVKLSGGQRQRVTLARVILKNAPILLLDEATSALDSEVEAAIQDTLYGMMEGKTVIAIAHRLSTIAQMDRILVLDQGRIVEDGTHDALLAAGGLYADFWTRQSGGFLTIEGDA